MSESAAHDLSSILAGDLAVRTSREAWAPSASFHHHHARSQSQSRPPQSPQYAPQHAPQVPSASGQARIQPYSPSYESDDADSVRVFSSLLLLLLQFDPVCACVSWLQVDELDALDEQTWLNKRTELEDLMTALQSDLRVRILFFLHFLSNRCLMVRMSCYNFSVFSIASKPSRKWWLT